MVSVNASLFGEILLAIAHKQKWDQSDKGHGIVAIAAQIGEAYVGAHIHPDGAIQLSPLDSFASMFAAASTAPVKPTVTIQAPTVTISNPATGLPLAEAQEIAKAAG